jgi:hypothetical protein
MDSDYPFGIFKLFVSNRDWTLRWNDSLTSSRRQEKLIASNMFVKHFHEENRQHNDQKEKYKRTNSDLQNIHTELTIEQHENHLKPGVGSGAQEG